MILKLLLVVAILATYTTVKATPPKCICGSNLKYRNAVIQAAIRKAAIFEQKPQAERPEYPRQYENRKRFSFSQFCDGVAPDQLYEFPLLRGYGSGKRRRDPGYIRVIYNHSNGEFCGCVTTAHMCDMVDDGPDTPSSKPKKGKAGSSKGPTAGSASGSAVGSNA